MFSLFCLLSNVTVPEVFNLQNFTLTIGAVDTKLCPKIHAARFIRFNLFTRMNPDKPQILVIGDDYALKKSYIEFGRRTIIFFHGYTESLLASDSQTLKNSFLERSDYNVILADARILLAGLHYPIAAKNCKFIGRQGARFVDYLVTRGLNLVDLHVIGFSLGAHIAGYVGNFLTAGRLPRITGLDPAGPLFDFKPTEERLDPGDAEFVDVIHTSSFTFGYFAPCGHVDFYPNGGGPKQPGCEVTAKLRTGSLNEIVFCEHYRAFRLFARTVTDPYIYPSKKCLNMLTAKLAICSGPEIGYLGLAVNKRARGIYYVDSGTDATF